MLVKTFIFNLYLVLFNFSFYLFLSLVFFSYMLLFSSLRKKFIFFILTILVYSVWGFMLNLDGIILILLTTEFTILLLFLMTYLQIYSNFTFFENKITFLTLLPIFLIFLFYEPSYVFFFYTSFYKSISFVVSSDFYILYYFLFEKAQLVTIFLTIVISFFSLFFILMYFSLKNTKLETTKQLNNIYFLRKQTLTKQTKYNTKLYTFQN